MRNNLLPFSTSVLLLSACAGSSSSSSSQDPNAGQYDGYHGAQPGSGAGQDTAGGGGTGPKPRDSTSTRGVGASKGIAKHMTPKKPPRDTSKPGGFTSTPSPNLAVAGFVPTTAPAGSQVVLLGSGFAAKDNKVTVGGVDWEVKQASAEKLLLVVPSKAKDGKIKVKASTKSVNSSHQFTVLKQDEAFGRIDADAAQGLLGTVYAIPSPVSELPAFGELGDPIAVIAVDTLDISATKFEQGLPSGPGKRIKEWFGIHFKGSLNVTAGGEYNFCLNADDGAQLYLDETLLVNNDGAHTAKEVCELVYIDPGEYQVDVLYYQGAGSDVALQWTWAKDGGEKSIVPASALFPPSEAPLLE